MTRRTWISKNLPTLALSSLTLAACKVQATGNLDLEGNADGGASVSGDGSVDVEPATKPKRVKLALQGDELEYDGGCIDFKFNSAELELDELSAEAGGPPPSPGPGEVDGCPTRETLETILDFLQRAPEVRLVIEGHADSRGRASANRKLSGARAESIRAWLIEQGIDSSRLEAVGYGEDQPKEPEPEPCHNYSRSKKGKLSADDEATCEAVWAVNRRSIFRVTEGLASADAALTVAVDNERPPTGSSDEASREAQDIAFHTGPWLYFGPGLALHATNFTATQGVLGEVQFFVGAGYLWVRPKGFALSVTGDAEFGGYRAADSSDVLMRLGPTLRLGYAPRRVFVYGRLEPQIRVGGPDDVGASFALGAGISGLVTRRFTLGIEPGLDFDESHPDRRGTAVNGDVKLMLGFLF